MSDASQFAAIWPLKAKTKKDFQVVSVSSIKNFKEKKKFGTELFRFKPAGAEKSSLVFILLTGSKLFSLSFFVVLLGFKANKRLSSLWFVI